MHSTGRQMCALLFAPSLSLSHFPLSLSHGEIKMHCLSKYHCRYRCRYRSTSLVIVMYYPQITRIFASRINRSQWIFFLLFKYLLFKRQFCPPHYVCGMCHKDLVFLFARVFVYTHTHTHIGQSQSIASNAILLTDTYRNAICETRYLMFGANVVDMCVFTLIE